MILIRNLAFAVVCGASLGAAVGARAGTFSSLHSFQDSPDGANPTAGLLDVDGTLFETTMGGGAYGLGTVAAVNPSTGADTIVYSFSSRRRNAGGYEPDASLINVGGVLYSTTLAGGSAYTGTVFAVDLATGVKTTITSLGTKTGNFAFGSLIKVGRKLYGTAHDGGGNKGGTVFSVGPETGAKTLVHSFGSGADGSSPYGGLIELRGKLYGTTEQGGSGGYGTVFSVVPGTGAETVLYSFKGSKDGASPFGSLTVANGLFYGTTAYGGGDGCNGGGCGTVFSLDPTTGLETVVYRFQGGQDGETPHDGVLKVGNQLYGTTESGGGSANCNGAGCGTVFVLNPATGVESIVHAFQGTDGDTPAGNLIDVGGTLYGTTIQGGAAYSGTVYTYTP